MKTILICYCLCFQNDYRYFSLCLQIVTIVEITSHLSQLLIVYTEIISFPQFSNIKLPIIGVATGGCTVVIYNLFPVEHAQFHFFSTSFNFTINPLESSIILIIIIITRCFSASACCRQRLVDKNYPTYTPPIVTAVLRIRLFIITPYIFADFIY